MTGSTVTPYTPRLSKIQCMTETCHIELSGPHGGCSWKRPGLSLNNERGSYTRSLDLSCLGVCLSDAVNKISKLLGIGADVTTP